MRLLGFSKQVLRSSSLSMNICTPVISIQQSARTLITAITHKQLGQTISQCGYKGVPVTFQKCTSICAISWHAKTGLRFYTSPATGDKKAQKVQGIQELISATSIAKRATRRKKPGTRGTEEGVFKARAYSTAEEYDLEAVRMALEKQGLYDLKTLPDDVEDALYVSNKYALEEGEEPREVFFFREGSVIFWNVPRPERNGVLRMLMHNQQDAYDSILAEDESEQMDYIYSDTGSSNIAGSRIRLLAPVEGDEETVSLEKYAFSNALSLSVKLGMWEASLDKYVDTIEYVTQDMREGKKLRISRRAVFQKTGELFTLKHLINLSSDLLDTPDFYWDREHLEEIYQKACSHLNISRRTRVMNEKLNHCCELTDLLTSHLNDTHHVRLEWMIIILILVEVLIELKKHV